LRGTFVDLVLANDTDRMTEGGQLLRGTSGFIATVLLWQICPAAFE
jgi:hypothetical protein